MRFGVCSLLICLIVAGCKKSTPPEADSSGQPKAPALETAAVDSQATLLRLHWIGKKRLAAETNAAYLMSIWNLPESVALENQTLDKLATAPWRLLGKAPADHASAATNADVAAGNALLRPLLNDLIQEESHLELRQATTNSPMEWALALKLSTERSALWKKNLGTVLTNLYGATNRIRVEQSEGWIVVSGAPTTSGIAKDMLSRVKRATAAATNYWVEAAINLDRCPEEALGPLKKLGPVPRIALNVIGEHDNVRTRAELQYPGPIPFETESWNFPTNLIREPLVGFTAVRGIKPWLEKSEHWNRLQLGQPPNQLYIWSLQGIPLQTYFAAPMTDASNRLEKLSERLVQQGNPWLAKYGMGNLERWTNGNALSWIDIPFISPHLQAWPTPTGEFLEGGFFPLRGTNTPPPDELLKQIFAKTNLVSYDWEITAARADAWLHLGQLLRLLFKKAQLPAEAAGIVFLKAASPRLGNCGTMLTREGEDKLIWVRQSSMGMTGFELHLLLDWLEAPQFPAGLYTTGATNLMIYPKSR